MSKENLNNENLDKGGSGSGSSVTATSMFAASTGGCKIVVVPEGTCVPLPDEQDLDGFKANKKNTTFTVPRTGKFVINYSVALAVAVQLSTRLLLNGEELSASVLAPVMDTSNYMLTFHANLKAGDTLSLQLFDFCGVAVLQNGVGAALTVVQLS